MSGRDREHFQDCVGDREQEHNTSTMSSKGGEGSIWILRWATVKNVWCDKGMMMGLILIRKHLLCVRITHIVLLVLHNCSYEREYKLVVSLIFITELDNKDL